MRTSSINFRSGEHMSEGRMNMKLKSAGIAAKALMASALIFGGVGAVASVASAAGLNLPSSENIGMSSS